MKVLILFLVMLPVLSYGKTPKKVDFNKVNKIGVPIVSVGKAMPISLWSELIRVKREMAKARKALYNARTRTDADRNNILKLAGNVVELENKLKHIISNYGLVHNNINTELNKLKNLLVSVNTEYYLLSNKFKKHLDEAHRTLSYIISELDKLRRKSYGIGLTVNTGLNWGISGEDLVSLNSLGLVAYWSNDVLIFYASISAGVNAVDTALSWSFLPSVEYKMLESWSFGPAMELSQDLGDMVGAQKMLWNFGGRIRYIGDGWSISAIPIMAGVRGEKGVGGGDPNWSLNLSSMISFDLYLVH